jgi:hypothetical protein
MSHPNPDTLVAVSAYSGDQDQVENNLYHYMHHGCPVVILSPADAPITKVADSRVHCQWAGEKGWIGPQTLVRQRLFLEMLLKFPQKYFLLNDADSVCLSSILPRYLYQHPDMIWSNEVLDTNPSPSLLPKLALQPPYFFSRKAVKGMLAMADNLPTSYTGTSPDGWTLPFPTECIDHYMLQLAIGSGFPHFNFHTGASFETTSQHGLETMAELVRHHGRDMIHQIKTKPVLDRLVREHEGYIRSLPPHQRRH